LILLLAINLPAVQAACRTSPLDGLNMNRTFPGDLDGTTTQQISHYLDSVVYAMADALMDLHSGGTSLEMVPSAIVEPAADPTHTRRNVEAVLAFDAPLAVVLNNLGDPRTSTAAAVRRGLTVVGTELGSAGAVSIEGIAVCERGVRKRPRPSRRLGGDAPAEPAAHPFHPRCRVRRLRLRPKGGRVRAFPSARRRGQGRRARGCRALPRRSRASARACALHS
jgi:hypothetical protein